MITQVLPIKVPECWDVAKPGVHAIARKNSLPVDKLSVELFKRCCAGVMQLWLLVDGDGVIGFLITELSTDNILETRALNIYLLYAYRAIPKEVVEEGKAALNAFAKANSCIWITFTTDTPDVITVVSKWWPGWELRPALRRAVA